MARIIPMFNLMVTPEIQKVPQFLRSKFVGQYGPRMVSLGPIHHQIGDRYKRELIIAFERDSGQQFNVLLGQIRSIINQLRSCFNEEETRNYNDNQLALLLCEDGCAILQYMFCPPTEKMYHAVAQDILLLENQIPYEVLRELMRLSNCRDGYENSIATFIKKQVNLPSMEIPHVPTDGNHVHLLDLLRKSLLGRSQAETRNMRRILPSFRNVQELKAAGIYLRQSSDWFLRNIVFGRRFHLIGRLYLPPITVDDSTRLKFLNLVAYEMCLDFRNDSGPGVISYLFFLHSLINEAKDVKELRDAGVLYNFYGNDTDLQTLIRELRDAGVFPDEPEAYIGVKEKIQEYYGTLMSKIVQFYHAKIKDNSWPLAIFFAVLLDLFFGGTQSWFAFKT